MPWNLKKMQKHALAESHAERQLEGLRVQG